MDNLSRVAEFLRDDDWNFEQIDDKPMLKMGFKGKAGRWTIFVTVFDDGIVAVDSMLDQFVPDEARAEVARFATLVNYGTRTGGFQLDLSDGEIRYHTGIDVEGGELTEKMFHNLLYSNVVAMDRHFKAIMAVCYAGVSAEAAHAGLESE